MHPLPEKSLLEIRGFDVIMFSGDRSTIFAVHKKTGISLRYLPAQEEFELSYVLFGGNLTYTIKSGICGSFSDEKQFTRYFDKLEKIIGALRWQGILPLWEGAE